MNKFKNIVAVFEIVISFFCLAALRISGNEETAPYILPAIGILFGALYILLAFEYGDILEGDTSNSSKYKVVSED